MTTGEDDVERLTPTYRAMSPLEKWETLVLNGLIGTNEPWIADMRQSLAALAAMKRELVEALETIVAGNFNCSPHQRFMAAQGVAERALASIGERS